MSRTLKLLASLLTPFLAPALSLFAAEPAPALPAIAITQVEAEDPAIYVMQVARINEVMKAKFGVDTFLRVYAGDAAGTDTGGLFAVARGDSFATLLKNTGNYQTDPALADLRAGINTIRELGSRTLLKAVRFDGAHPNASLYNSYANITDEAGYLTALGQLRSLFDSHGLTDVKINTYRVIAGRTDYTHLVSLNTSAPDRLAALLDAVSTQAWAIEWIGASAKFRTIVRNGTYREMTR